MYRVIGCLAHEHSYGLVVLAALVCAIGSCLTAILSQQLIKTTGQRQKIQLGLASLIAGTTVWSTHFIAMLAYDPGVEHDYEPIKTTLSLGVAVIGMFAANAVLARGTTYPFFLISGALFGGTVASMHFLGMSAYLLPGTLHWDIKMILISIVLGMAFGAAAHHRIAYPTTKYCWLGGAILMVLAICAMHFTGMAAFEIRLNSLYSIPPQAVTDSVIAALVLGVTTVILLIGFASVSIEKNVENETKNQLQYAALHDALTHLPNRLHLDQKMTKLQHQLEQDETYQVAMFTLDLNSFREINDLYGHSEGDTLLKEVAMRLADTIHHDEFVARFGNDEFVAIKHGFHRIDEVLVCAERIHGRISEPLNIGQTSAIIGLGIGIATSLSDGRDIRDLLHKSNLALQRSKTESDTNICIFDIKMDQQSQDKLMLVNDLRQALVKEEFELAYQFQNDMNSNEVIGFEALIRWNHPTRGRVSPAQFIPLAEETGLILEIGLWVLRTACKEAAQWETPYTIAINVAPQQLVQPSFLEHVSDILLETGLNPERMELEITEASIIDDQAYTLKVMHKLQEMGIRIAMDDFGTGYSSLAMLQAFPFNKIKIDRSFIRDVHKNDQSAAIVRSTLLLADAFNIPVLAEGVEHEEELMFLRQIKCSAVQGFYFGKPMSLEELHTAIDEPQRKKA